MTQMLPRSSDQLTEAAHTPAFITNVPGKLAKPAEISRPTSTAPRTADTTKQVADTLSDKATAAFVRRTLCAHHLSGSADKAGSSATSIEGLLPPLTSSNEVDLQLYAIIAVILKEFVYTWYAKITPDHVFVDEVIQTIAHCSRGLEERLRKVDLEGLLFDEIPALVDAHLTGVVASTPDFCRLDAAGDNSACNGSALLIVIPD